MLDFAALNDLAAQRAFPLRVCDVACGTGVLLQQLAVRLPGCELYGFDASPAMLAQASQILQAYPSVHLLPHLIGTTTDSMLPPHFHDFDLVTCSNVLHDIQNPVGFLQQLGSLLAPGGVLVLEDYARREPLFPWILVEILGKLIERGHVRAYTLAEVRSLCSLAGLRLDAENAFVVDRLWHGWALRLSL